MTHSGRLSWKLLTTAAGLVAATMLIGSGSATAEPQHAGVARPQPTAATWQQYTQGTSGTAYPVRVVSTSGQVTNADALIHPRGAAATVISRAPGDPAPAVVLDYGRDVGGVPEFGVQAVSGSPLLSAGYAEVLRFLTPTGDGGRPFQSGDPARSDTYRVASPGTVTNQYIQGGERYEEITLQSPGSVTLSFARIDTTTYPETSSSYRGYFLSSSVELNKLWYAGTHTLALNMLPPNSPAGFWSIQDGYLRDTGGDTGLLKTGNDWTDYTMSFKTRINGQQSGFVVRGASNDTKYLLILDNAVDHVGQPNVLQEVVFNGGHLYHVADLPLATPIEPRSWHAVSVTVRGTTVSTSIDGQVVGGFDSTGFPSGVSGIPAGNVGFREDSGIGEATDFEDLTVTAPDGTVLYQNSLGDAASLADFHVPGVNEGHLIMDGAKRDRDVWEGDLSVEAPTLFYSFGAPEYVRDSLHLLGSYQLQSGFIQGRRAPGDPVNTGGPLPGTVSQYSASYSMYFVANLATYYRYTGDLAFVRDEWPVVQRELAWNAQQVDAQGLFETNASDGNNWHYDDQTGAQTYYNILYYRILRDAAEMAAASGDQAAASNYQAQAASVKEAVNRYLFDPATGIYDISTTQRGSVAQDANACAVLYGIAPAERVASILAAMSKALGTAHGDLSVPSPAPAGYHQVIGPFMGSYELWARFAAGDASGAFDLLDREWGQMVDGDPGGVLWEVMGPDGTVQTPGINGSGDGATSMAHGWSTGPTSALSQYVLGIAPDSPGYQTWSVVPHPGQLAWAQGRAPTPHGALSVAWSHETSGRRFTLDVTPPAGTSGTIAVPLFGSPAAVHVNGRLVWAQGSFHRARGVTAAVATGDYLRISVAAEKRYRITSQVTDK
jgi:alpha-L-rhamnosidase